MTDDLSLVRELNRMKVMFQQRTICAVLGIPAPTPTTERQPQPRAGRDELEGGEGLHFHNEAEGNLG